MSHMTGRKSRLEPTDVWLLKNIKPHVTFNPISNHSPGRALNEGKGVRGGGLRLA